jgi:Kdo2-lipid IVA lauroyltransferase/acyltransferase
MSVALGILSAFVARLPWRALASLGAALGWLVGSVLRIRRAHVERSMRRAGVDDPSRCARAMYRDLGRGVLELAWLTGQAPDARSRALAAHARIDDAALATLDDAVTRGPVVLFASHTGNWEIAAALAAAHLGKRGRHLAVVAKSMHARGIDAFVRKMREAFGVRLLSPEGAIATVRARLCAGDVIVMPIDQVPDRAEHGDRRPFLGGSALVDRAPSVIAQRAGATVLVVVAAREVDADASGAPSCVVRVIDRIEPGSATVAETSARATAALEAFVRESPSQWLWMHRRWKDVPAARAARRSCRAPVPRVIQETP